VLLGVILLLRRYPADDAVSSSSTRLAPATGNGVGAGLGFGCVILTLACVVANCCEDVTLRAVRQLVFADLIRVLACQEKPLDLPPVKMLK
jgi:hypothetical protein